MKIPSPHECGLPEKFDKWRGNQPEAIRVMITSDKRVTAVCAPTGFGKSPAYIAAAILSKKPTCIVTNSRGLQDQLMDDYSSIGLVDIRGRRNYTCDLKPDYTCEDGYAARCPYKGTIGCPASQAEMRAATSSLVVTNYDKWTSAKKFGQGMSHFQQVIFDEGHDAPDALARAMQVQLNQSEIEEGLKIDFLRFPASTDMSNWKPWAQNARAIAEIAMIAAGARIAGQSDPKPSWVRHFTHMRNLCRRLAILSNARADDWVVDEAERGYQFDPIRPGRYAESALLLRIPKIIVVSATLRPKTLYMIGVGRDNSQFTEFDSDFDPKRCPIYYIPTMRVDSRAEDLGMLWLRLDQIIAKRRDRKGIVHTVSYDRQREIMDRSRFRGSMLVNLRGEPATAMIEQFKNSGPGTMLVSPSVGTGYDFPLDECEWQFMCKIPFQPPSKIVKAREHDDPEYRSYQAMQTLVQSFGRGMRSKEDRCENFLADDHAEWFIPRYGHLAPRSFHGFFRRVSVLPQPPDKL